MGFNLLLFLVIGVGYTCMYMSIRYTMASAGGVERKKHIIIARKMMIIVLTDFICWVPIIGMGGYTVLYHTGNFVMLVSYHMHGCVYIFICY